MKKIFTLIAVMVLAVSGANAKKTLDITAFNPWGATCTWDAATSTLSYSSAWSGAGLWLGGDFSDYDVIVLKMKSCTCGFNLAAEYLNEAGDGVDESKGKSLASGSAGTKIAAVTLNEDYSNGVAQIWIQAVEAGAIEIEEIYAGTREEFEADLASNVQHTSDVSLKNWGKWGSETLTENEDGTLTIAFAAAWGGVNKWFGGYDASAFDYCIVELQPADFIVQLFLQYAAAGADGSANVTAQAQPGETEIRLQLDATAKAAINQIAIQNGDAGQVTIKRIYFATADYATGIGGAVVKAGAATKNDNVRYNLAGQKVGESYKGMVILNGKKVIM